MLSFILGPAASGKTYTILQKIRECVASGKRPILLVPEQFSFESEKAVLDTLGDGGAQSVSVVSFTRLCDEIERETGGLCGKAVTEADKIILMRRAVKKAAPELKRWQKYSNSAGFATGMIDTISEFKLNAVSPDDLLKAAEITDDTSLSSKLVDTAVIYSYYNALISGSFTDPSDRLERLYSKLEYHRFFEGKTVFIDSFKSFTGQQLRILDRIIAQAQSITVSLASDTKAKSKFGIFSGLYKTEQRIRKMAAAHGRKCSDDIILSEHHYASPELAAAERLLATGKTDSIGSCENITVCKAETVFDEAEFVARSIRKTVRKEGARYRDFVIIARDTAPYEEALSSACFRNGVSCFTDRPFILSSLPPARAAVSAMDAALRLSTEKIFLFHKSGIDLISPEDLSRLENYTYLWNIEGSLWQKEWDMDPKGLVSDENHKPDNEELADINRLRVIAVKPMTDFASAFTGTAADMARALIRLFEVCHAKEAFLRLYNEHKSRGEVAYADALRQSWDEMTKLLDSIALCFGEEEIQPSEFFDAFKTAASLATVGVTPQMLDEAIFGTADRIRPSRPKYAFIMGANQGFFPRNPSPSGLFGNSERAKLIDLGLDIPDKTLAAAMDESFLVYSNVCCPTHKLFISYNSVSAEGGAAEPSAFVGQICEALHCRKVYEPAELTADNLPETEEAAFTEACKRYVFEVSEAKALGDALGEGYRRRMEDVALSRVRKRHSVSPDTAVKLFGDSVRMNPSKFDNFSRCKFMFFCKNGLNLSRLQPAEFDAMQRGTLVHYVLQRMIETYGKGISMLTEAEISSEVDRLTEEYLDSIVGYRSIETPRSRYLISTMKRSVKYVVSRLALEFAQSEFEPYKCELKIGATGEIPEIVIPVDDTRNLRLSGTVDRLDRWNGYIRIIDYKTGHRDFKLPDILFGQNMQMLIYLYAVCAHTGEQSAGIFYMPSRRVKAGSPKDRRMSGIMPANEELVYAMEKENNGNFIPKLTATPSESFIADGDFEKIFDFIEKKLKASAKSIFEGNIASDPVDGVGSDACKYCDFAAVCRIEDEKHGCVPKLSNLEVMQQIEKEVSENGI